MRRFSTSLLIAALPVLLAGTGIAQAATETGCMTRSGTFIRFQDGESPQRACNTSRGEKVIHFENRQNNNQVLFDFEAVCKALDGAGAQQADLVAMGCPITPVVPGIATELVRVGDAGPIKVAPYEECGLKFEQRPEWNNLWHVTVYGIDDYTGNSGGGYLAQTIRVDRTSGHWFS